MVRPTPQALALFVSIVVLIVVGIVFQASIATAQQVQAWDGEIRVERPGSEIQVGDGCVSVKTDEREVGVGSCEEEQEEGTAEETTGASDEISEGGEQETTPSFEEDTTPLLTMPEEEASASPPSGESAADEQYEGGGADEEVCPVGPPEDAIPATVERVVDGDTVDLLEPIEGARRVRLIGVNTPELDGREPGSREARDFTTEELEGREVLLKIGENPEDEYGRLLVYVWVGSTNAGEESRQEQEEQEEARGDTEELMERMGNFFGGVSEEEETSSEDAQEEEGIDEEGPPSSFRAVPAPEADPEIEGAAPNAGEEQEEEQQSSNSPKPSETYELFNRTLVEEGHAEVFTVEPNDAYRECFEEALSGDSPSEEQYEETTDAPSEPPAPREEETSMEETIPGETLSGEQPLAEETSPEETMQEESTSEELMAEEPPPVAEETTATDETTQQALPSASGEQYEDSEQSARQEKEETTTAQDTISEQGPVEQSVPREETSGGPTAPPAEVEEETPSAPPPVPAGEEVEEAPSVMLDTADDDAPPPLAEEQQEEVSPEDLPSVPPTNASGEPAVYTVNNDEPFPEHMLPTETSPSGETLTVLPDTGGVSPAALIEPPPSHKALFLGLGFIALGLGGLLIAHFFVPQEGGMESDERER